LLVESRFDVACAEGLGVRLLVAALTALDALLVEVQRVAGGVGELRQIGVGNPRSP
jgi:hypothetical protein